MVSFAHTLPFLTSHLDFQSSRSGLFDSKVGFWEHGAFVSELRHRRQSMDDSRPKQQQRGCAVPHNGSAAASAEGIMCSESAEPSVTAEMPRDDTAAAARPLLRSEAADPASPAVLLRVKAGGHDCFDEPSDDAELCCFLQSTVVLRHLTD